MYTIRPIFHGVFIDFDKSLFTYKQDPGVKIDVPLVSYLVEGDGLTVLVDAGPPNPKLAKGMTHRKVERATFLKKELQKMGVETEQIDFIILTHLHWDHSYNLELFPGVPIYVQKRELQYAVAPLPSDSVPYCYDPRNGKPSWFTGFQQMRVVDGDAEVAPGISLALLPGHTPGIQGVRVETEEGVYLIASDTYPLYENYEKMSPSGIHVDLKEWFASYEKTKKICDFILPGHDMRVLDRKIYGVREK